MYLYALSVFQFGGLDEWIIGHFFDPALQAFPLKHGFWTERILHDGGRRLMLALAGLLAFALAVSWSALRWQAWRLRLAYLLLVVLLSVSAVNLGKQFSNVDCPWDLAVYGGERVHYGLFDAKPLDAPRGRCFPGGHSSAGFALLALYFVGLSAGVRRPGLLLLPGILVGSLFAVDQWVRGAHFPSHDLTTAYLCWGFAVLCFRMLPAPVPSLSTDA
ncbi:MAG: phosphatase PAP2 family protein [Gammaproteobacteria bacterium]|nr:phosphatase PAP2 family protein [Gammaproteobacteria bacterium]